MPVVIPALLVAALVALLGSMLVALSLGAVRFAGAARLALAEGVTGVAGPRS